MAADKVLVTGASGFVGSAVARALIGAGYQVRAMLQKTSKRVNLAGLDVESVEGDMRDAAALFATWTAAFQPSVSFMASTLPERKRAESRRYRDWRKRYRAWRRQAPSKRLVHHSQTCLPFSCLVLTWSLTREGPGFRSLLPTHLQIWGYRFTVCGCWCLRNCAI